MFFPDDNRWVAGPYVIDLKAETLQRNGVNIPITSDQFSSLGQMLVNPWDDESPRMMERMFWDADVEGFAAKFSARAMERGWQPVRLKARATWERAQVNAHTGIAMIECSEYENTRLAERPDRGALQRAIKHAREALGAAPDFGEAHAWLGFALDRSGQRREGLTAVRRAVEVNPHNLIVLLLACEVTWGEERLTLARRLIERCPSYGMGQLMAATVLVARSELAEAERLIDEARAIMPRAKDTFMVKPRGVHMMKAALALIRSDQVACSAAVEAEINPLDDTSIYDRELRANAYCAFARFQVGHDSLGAHTMFTEALKLAPRHDWARSGVEIMDSRVPPCALPADTVDGAVARARVIASRGGDIPPAVALVSAALAAAPPGPDGWMIPIDPFLRVREHREAWAPVLDRVRTRAEG